MKLQADDRTVILHVAWQCFEAWRTVIGGGTITEIENEDLGWRGSGVFLINSPDCDIFLIWRTCVEWWRFNIPD